MPPALLVDNRYPAKIFAPAEFLIVNSLAFVRVSEVLVSNVMPSRTPISAESAEIDATSSTLAPPEALK